MSSISIFTVFSKTSSLFVLSTLVMRPPPTINWTVFSVNLTGSFCHRLKMCVKAKERDFVELMRKWILICWRSLALCCHRPSSFILPLCLIDTWKEAHEKRLRGFGELGFFANFSPSSFSLDKSGNDLVGRKLIFRTAKNGQWKWGQCRSMTEIAST